MKCPSIHEMGFTYTNCNFLEGSLYPIFGSSLIIDTGANNPTNEFAEYTTVEGNSVGYHTRTLYSGNKRHHYVILNFGSLSAEYSSYSEGTTPKEYAIACIRF